jgi:glycosyltransferase involved in cell wall biosynthesis
MRILIVSISAPPKNAPESVQTGRYIQYLKRENDITLLTSRVAGGWSPADAGLKKFIEDVRRVEVGVLPYRMMVLLKRIVPSLFVPDDEADFIWRWRSAIKKVDQKPDLIYSRSAPFSSALMARKLADHWECPWVMHLSDPWADSPFRNAGPRRVRHLELEEACIKRASAITLTSRKTVEWYTERYPDFASKFFLMPNVFDPETINTEPPHDSPVFRLVFTGRLYGSRSLHSFIEILKDALRRWPRLLTSLEIILAGFFDKSNIEAVEEANLPNVRYEGPVSLEAAMALQRSANMLLVIDSLEDDKRFDLFFPSKLLDYMAANRPILAITRSSSTTFDVVDGKLGVCFDETTLSNIGPYLNECVSAFLTNGHSGHSFRNENLRQYSAETNAEKLNQLFKQFAG